MKKGGGSESSISVGPSKSVLVYALHSLEYVLGLARIRMFVPNLYYILLPFNTIYGARKIEVPEKTKHFVVSFLLF